MLEGLWQSNIVDSHRRPTLASLLTSDCSSYTHRQHDNQDETFEDIHSSLKSSPEMFATDTLPMYET